MNHSDLGAPIRSYSWRWQNKTIVATYEVLGTGTPILLLPALSTISSREEMRGLATYLAQKHQVFLLDWIGFGESDRPRLDYTPGLYKAFLRDFVQATFSEPIVVMAAGHSAGYVMDMALKRPALWSWVVLLAPTWRGPLPVDDGRTTAIVLSHPATAHQFAACGAVSLFSEYYRLVFAVDDGAACV